MNINVERLENHRARITVQLDADYMTNANRRVAVKLSSDYRIPGFRKGKAPYNVIVNILGQALVTQTTLDMIADDIYPRALRQSGLNPYTSGTLDDVKMDPTPVFVFTVPLRPEVTRMADYRSVRVEYLEQTVTDEEVDESLRRAKPAERRPHEGPLEAGMIAVVDLHSHFVDGDERPEEVGDTVLGRFYKGDEFEHLHDHDMQLSHEAEPILPGMVDQLIGAKVGDTLSFELTAPTDDEEFEDIAGRVIHFDVTVKGTFIEKPIDLTDELAAELTASENPPLNLEQIRERVRTNLMSRKVNAYDNQYVTSVIDQIAEQSDLDFPEEAVESQIDEKVEDLKESLKEQGLSIDFYKQVLNLTDETLRERFREESEQFIRRSLVVSEIVKDASLSATGRDIDAEIERMIQDQPPRDQQRLRAAYNRREQRETIAGMIVSRRINDFLLALGRGLLETPVNTAATSES